MKLSFFIWVLVQSLYQAIWLEFISIVLFFVWVPSWTSKAMVLTVEIIEYLGYYINQECLGWIFYVGFIMLDVMTDYFVDILCHTKESLCLWNPVAIITWWLTLLFYQGFVMNLQPSEAEAGFDVRVPPTTNPESLERRIAEEWAPASRNMTFEVTI